jgi:serine/threonine-protein kinase
VARAILRQVANAVAAAHARGIVHRDLKPDNVFLVSEGGATDAVTIKILDFGIAKLAKGDRPFAITTTRELLGTPVYISPEQCKGAKNLDHRSDIYSLGCIAFEMLTGQPVFIADSLGELIASHMFKEPPAIVDLEPAVPPALGELVRRMLAKSPEDRPRSMEEVVEAIDAAGPPAALRGAVVALPPGRPIDIPSAEAAGVTGAPTLTVGEYESHPKHAPTPAAPTPPVPTPGPSVVAPAPRGRAVLGLAAGVALAVGVVVWLAVSRPSREPPPVAAPAPAAPALKPPAPSATVNVDVEDPPAGLTVRVDGKPAALPIALTRGPGQHALVFEAPGHEPVTRSLDGTKDRSIVLAMRPVVVAPPPPAKPTAKPPVPAAKASSRKAAKAPAAAKPPGKKKTDLFLDL